MVFASNQPENHKIHEKTKNIILDLKNTCSQLFKTPKIIKFGQDPKKLARGEKKNSFETTLFESLHQLAESNHIYIDFLFKIHDAIDCDESKGQ